MLKQNYFNYALVQLIWELVCPLNIVVMELQMCGAEVNVNEEMSWNFESLIAWKYGVAEGGASHWNSCKSSSFNVLISKSSKEAFMFDTLSARDCHGETPSQTGNL